MAVTTSRRTVGERRLLGSLAPVSRTVSAPSAPTGGVVAPTARRSITELFNAPVRQAATVPATSYIPGTDVARVPGFYNPLNPNDTGRHGETNAELGGGTELLPGWDYDLGRPINANAKLNAQGYYELGSPGGGGAGGGSSSDPMLQKIRALAQQSLSNARSQAVALRKQAAIDTGDEAIAKQIGLDDATVAAVAANPFSRRKNFLNDALQAETELEQGLNADNLFYSGHRVNELSELGRKRAEGEATIGSDLRSQLALIDQNLAEAEYQAQLQELEAQRQAMLDALLSGGYGGYGGDEYADSYGGGGPYFVELPGSGYEGSVPREYDDPGTEAALASLIGSRRVGSQPITMAQKLAMLR